MSKLVLVVEDQEDNRQILRDLLHSANYEMMEADNGEEALAAVARQRPDLILMDIQLPLLDGYEATRRIKSDPALRSIPIIAVTSYPLSGDEYKGREAGCDDYVTKPYSPRQLLAKIRERPSCRQCGGVAADPRPGLEPKTSALRLGRFPKGKNPSAAVRALPTDAKMVDSRAGPSPHRG